MLQALLCYFTFLVCIIGKNEEELCYLEAPLPVFAGSFLNDGYIPSGNAQGLERLSGIFLILHLGMEWIFKQTKSESQRMVNAASTRTGGGVQGEPDGHFLQILSPPHNKK